MQRSLLLILFCLSAAVLSGLWWLLGAAPPPAPLDGAGGVDASATAPERLPAKADVVADPGAVVREAASTVGDLQQDLGEDLEVVSVPEGELDERMRRGEIDHAIVLATIALWRASRAG